MFITSFFFFIHSNCFTYLASPPFLKASSIFSRNFLSFNFSLKPFFAPFFAPSAAAPSTSAYKIFVSAPQIKVCASFRIALSNDGILASKIALTQCLYAAGPCPGRFSIDHDRPYLFEQKNFLAGFPVPTEARGFKGTIKLPVAAMPSQFIPINHGTPVSHLNHESVNCWLNFSWMVLQSV